MLLVQPMMRLSITKWDLKFSGELSATNRGTLLKFENIKCRIKMCIIDIPLLVSE